MEVRQSRTTVDEARAQLQRYTRQIASDDNALRLLVGGALPDDMPKTLNIHDPILAQVPAGPPSDLLQRRPDVRAAEHYLIGANANLDRKRTRLNSSQ